jgi:transcriptional regulator with XRE-family HTH domain
VTAGASKPRVEHWGEKLADLRRAAGLSQAALAKLLGTTQQVVSGSENARDPHASTLARYLDVLGYELAWIPRSLVTPPTKKRPAAKTKTT